MNRRQIAVAAAGLVLLGGAIAVLRTTGGGGPASSGPPSPAQPTAFKPYAADGVVLPEAGGKPQPPKELRVDAGPRRLQASWAVDKPAAPGYQVRWGHDGALDHQQLIAVPAVQLDGLDNGTKYQVEVRAVDAFGQRSDPATSAATPRPDLAEDAKDSFVDHFDGGTVPDPAKWRLAAGSECVRASPGDGANSKRLVVSGACGSDAVALRARTPFRLADPGQAADGELGRYVITTDAPGQNGELLLDLVPGAADLVDGSPGPPPQAGKPGLAQDDPTLPPGTIRVRIASNADAVPPTTTAQVLVPPGTPRIAPSTDTMSPLPATQIGISHRLEVVLRKDGVRVLRDGVLVGGGDVVPQWPEATLLIGLGGPAGGQLHVGIDLVAFAGVHADTPALLPPPQITTSLSELPETDAKKLAGALGGQLRLSLLPASTVDNTPLPAPNLAAVVHGVRTPLRPAIPGSPWSQGVHYPVVADLPPDALVLTSPAQRLAVAVVNADGTPAQGFRVVQADIELTPDPAAPSTAPRTNPNPSVRPPVAQLAMPGAELLDASGQRLDPGKTLPKGRLVLSATLDGAAGQRYSGELAGLAGFEVWLDDQRIAAVSTTRDGPGVAGNWRIAFNATTLAAGPHTMEVRAFGTDASTRYVSGFATFLLGQ
ncbi:hypothetical protein F0L68_12890 [Solihabitans fulvus]|uniref:Fibronectin type-III domain-containing protein n=1 Tax=Solihabitans fulvus TaxID=1892852 RepID=A0A5B2XEH6_9PSEU|nr:fibronectin type III domain-containing protein [Solihabitans fulvus]KAA2262188.1 hypothetical protein F0L68_12890 [Solihabitans fulvus]